MKLLFVPSLLLLLATASAQTCEWHNDQCPNEWRMDGECDEELDGCSNADCYDCDPMQEYRFDCEGCVENGGYWCPGDALCMSNPATADDFANIINYEGNHMINACPNETDWQQNCEPLSPDNVFSDPLYDAMAWEYKLIHVEEVWRLGITGKGVHVRVVDDGVDGDHPEFSARFDKENSCPNYLKAVDENHGTACASIIAAEGDNGVCAVGIAPGVTLSACSNDGSDDEEEAEIMLYNLNVVDVSSNSWGPLPCDIPTTDDDDEDDDRRGRRRLQCMFTYDHDDSPCNVCGDMMDLSDEDCKTSIIDHCSLYYDQEPTACVEYLDLFVECEYRPLPLVVQEAFNKAVTEGRDGKGVVFAFPAGNENTFGSNTNLDGFANSRLNMAVGAVDKNAKKTGYTTAGACVFVTAPAGDDEFLSNQMVANNGGGCRDAGVGTSFSTPTLAGVVALMLEANGNLTYRDVQGVIAATSHFNDPDEPTWITNAAGFRHNYFYGFGLVNAFKAVLTGQSWVNWGPEQQILGQSGTIDLPILDDPSNSTTSTIALEADGSSNGTMVLESVVVYIDLDHGTRGDLTIKVTSPSGTESLLAPGKRPENTQLEGEQHWKFMTVRNWGESPYGNWTLQIVDEEEGVLSECIDREWFYEGTGNDDDDGDDEEDDDDRRKLRGRRLLGDRKLQLDEWWNCDELARVGFCEDEAVEDDFANEVAVEREDGTSVTGAEACCVCGGGVKASDVAHVLKSWRVVAYVHEVETESNLGGETEVDRSSAKKSATTENTAAKPVDSTTSSTAGNGHVVDDAIETGLNFAPMSGSSNFGLGWGLLLGLISLAWL